MAMSKKQGEPVPAPTTKKTMKPASSYGTFTKPSRDLPFPPIL